MCIVCTIEKSTTEQANDDSSGMEQWEINQADAFANWLGGPIIDCCESGFLRHHDAMQFGALAADCYVYVASRHWPVED